MREKMQVSVCFLMFSIEMVSPFQDVFLITKKEIQSLFVAGAWNLQILGQDSVHWLSLLYLKHVAIHLQDLINTCFKILSTDFNTSI